MSHEALDLPAIASAVPKIGFVSLGCPKALTDSELILTRLSAEGYATSKTFAGADLVIVNTCGFIDDAVKESLDTIGEALAEAEDRLRLARLPEGADRLRADPDAPERRGLRDLEELRRRRPRHRQHLRLHRRRGQGEPRHDRRGAGRERPGDRHRLPRRQGGRGRRQPGAPDASERPRGDRPARDRRGDGRGPRPRAQAARPVRRPRSRAAGDRHQADAQALRLSQDQRGLQPSLHLLHHPEPARRPGLAADRRRPRRGGGAVRVGRQGAARHQPGHQRLRRRCALSHRLLERPAGQDPAAGALRAAGRDRRAARRVGPAALRLSVSARRRGAAADGDRTRSCRTSTCRSSIRTPTCCAG